MNEYKESKEEREKYLYPWLTSKKNSLKVYQKDIDRIFEAVVTGVRINEVRLERWSKFGLTWRRVTKNLDIMMSILDDIEDDVLFPETPVSSKVVRARKLMMDIASDDVDDEGYTTETESGVD